MTKPKVLNDHFRQSWKWICDQLEPARRWITANWVITLNICAVWTESGGFCWEVQILWKWKGSNLSRPLWLKKKGGQNVLRQMFSHSKSLLFQSLKHATTWLQASPTILTFLITSLSRVEPQKWKFSNQSWLDNLKSSKLCNILWSGSKWFPLESPTLLKDKDLFCCDLVPKIFLRISSKICDSNTIKNGEMS